MVNRVSQLAYLAFACTPNFIGVRMNLDMCPLTLMLIFSLWLFKVFKKFFLVLVLFKNLLVYIWPLICLSLEETDCLLFTFVLKKLYISIFHTKYF